ncbi:chromosomal replication initiator protein DnaA [Candidatus Falkowbacteria bacterium]|uniref:Chromosomal replication initiator protein DnaA n=1 Tax=Candidatus Buchananbacteria bacterium CG10_big_fil_rev_8_21_14_0_10_33_19 TaxID=1974525 RepID=A0A2H0W5B2_9BACT|nr:chromosomal replication initiator protein DnaA [Candidatus Falkowbacteria bacterium]PIS06539.1 MAG: chromosomal replication initiator protein DnaA [Candidatus Buchananbacteria bacterium CG10_big_fil_rev_8_21_14_0_10_33_19]
MNSQQLWQSALGELELSLSKANFTTWFKNTGISLIEGEKVVISVPNGFTKEWLEKKYHTNILKALKSVSDNKIKFIEYKIEAINQQKVVNTPKITESTEFENHSDPIIAENSTNEQQKTPLNINNNIKIEGFSLNPKYVFSSFIVGKNNELAHAASLAVAKNPGKSYNPLFIYGGVGLGKTHLLQAIGNKILIDNQNTKILYVSCEKFTNDYITAIRSGKADDFTKKYRSIDVLLIDDIQFISGKEQTQEAFFHTFNELHQNNKQVVISSDRPPKAISALEHRLVSRFEWGVIADVSIPDLETKIAIIETKLKEKDFNLNSDVIEYLASVIHNNIRELEGAINKITAHSQLRNKILDLDEIKQITSSIITDSQKKPLTPKYIINTVAEYFDIEIADIIGPCRKKNLAEPRQIIMYLMREEMRASYPTIGNEIGGRDHTTVIHAYDKIIRNLKTDDKLRQDINVLKQKLYTNG